MRTPAVRITETPIEKLSTTGTVLDYFTPSDQATLYSGNLDLGSGGVLLLPTQSGPYPDEMVSAGKDGTIYLVNRDNMGHYNASTDSDIQSLTDIFPNTIGDEGGNFSSPVYFNESVYFSPVGGPVQAFQLSNGLLSTAPTSESSETYNDRGGTMSISADGSSNGILWTLQSSATDPNGLPTTPGTLHAYAAIEPGRRTVQQQPGWFTRHARCLGQVQRPGRGEWRGLRRLR